MLQRALHGIELSEHIDWLLGRLFVEWKDVPLVACEWEDWDWVEKVDYELEWAIPRGQLRELESQVEAGALNDGQMARYRELKALIAQHEPTLERLFAEE